MYVPGSVSLTEVDPVPLGLSQVKTHLFLLPLAPIYVAVGTSPSPPALVSVCPMGMKTVPTSVRSLLTHAWKTSCALTRTPWFQATSLRLELCVLL